MHLALFLSGLAGGGAQRRMITLAAGFADRGYGVDLVVADGHGPFRAAVPPTVNLIELGNRWQRIRGLRDRRGLWVPASTFALSRYLRREQPDALLATSNPANLTALWARRLSGTGIPVAISLNVHLSSASRHGATRLLRWLARRCYPDAEAVIAISQGVAQDVAATADVRAERITVIQNPIDLAHVQRQAEARPPAFWPQDGIPVILGVGKLKRQKDFTTLIEAFALFRRHCRARLVILGDGELRPALQKRARDLGIADDLLLPGFVTNPHACMARAALFVLSSAWEGFSNALLEALACGCPVVATDCPSGPREILADGAYGALVPVGDPQGMARAIGDVLDAPPERGRLRRRAAEFSMGPVVDRYLEILSLLAQSARDATEIMQRPAADGVRHD